MSAYVVHQPLPLGVSAALAVRAWVCIDGEDCAGQGDLAVYGTDHRFVCAIRARLATCYGFSGRHLGPKMTQDDLHCAMVCLPMRELSPVWMHDWRPTIGPGSVSVGG